MVKEIQAQRITVTFMLNQNPAVYEVSADWTLLRFLREELGLTGTKCGCEIGECGSCTVLINGEAVNSCLVLAPQIDGAEVWTIEGVTPSGNEILHPIQRALIENDAVHCGFCSPGLVMAVISLLLKNGDPDESVIRTSLSGNLCRCTGYVQIIEAVKKVSAIIKEDDLLKFAPGKIQKPNPDRASNV